MYVRYQTVRNIGIGLLGAGAITGIVLAATSKSDPPPVKQAPPVVARETRKPTPQPLSAPTSAPATRPGTRGPATAALDDAAIIARADQAATPNEKVKDAIPGAVKVNLYEDSGDARYDRLKIDHNRDDVWDAEWSRKDGVWRNADDAAWDGARWAAPAAPAANADPTIAVAHVVLEGHASAEKVKDLYNGRGIKANLYDDDRDGKWDRAKIDHDRDDTWDESWTVKDGRLERKIEKTGAVSLFGAERWDPKP
ncbi:MAG: hypothetical protein IT385_23965 [Deltaproteobacteria bacterium]|nr:hypothetical protein [Deltaproteobacteria bacterium]